MGTAWPGTLPDYLLLENSAGAFGDNTIRSKMDAGPAKLRRRSTAMPDTYTGSQILTSSQLADLETFYKTTLVGGSLTITWKHPRSRAACDMRFLSPPTWAPRGKYWIATYQLEILP